MLDPMIKPPSQTKKGLTQRYYHFTLNLISSAELYDNQTSTEPINFPHFDSGLVLADDKRARAVTSCGSGASRPHLTAGIKPSDQPW